MTWLDSFADRIRAVTPFRRNEAGTAALMFAYSFTAMTAYNILKPLTRAKFIAVLGADNLPYVQLAAGLVIGVLMHLYGVATRRLPRRHVIPVTQAGIIGLLVAFWALFRTGAAWVPVAFYLLGLILGILLISQFWTLANDIYDARQAKRLFGFIGGGASLGGASGAAITAFVVDEVGSNNLLLVSAAALAVCAVIVVAIGRRHQLLQAGIVEEERGVGGRQALRLLMESRQLQILSLVIGFAAAGAVVVEQQLNMAAEALNGAVDSDAIAQFLAQVSVYLSLAGFALQVFLTSRIHRSFGIGVALLMLPITLGASATLVLLSGALWVVAGARVADATLRYTLDKTTREVLFLPLPSELKYRAKPFIDVTMDRFSKAAAALLVLVMIKPWGLGLDWRSLSYASLAMMAVWIGVALVARREYLRSFRSSLAQEAAGAESVRTPAPDAATTGLAALPTGEPAGCEAGTAGRTAAVEALARSDRPRFRSLLLPLLYDDDVAVARSAIRSARADGLDDGVFLPGLVSLLGHRRLKAEARKTLAAYGAWIVPALRHVLQDTREEAWVRRHVPSTLALIPAQTSLDALAAALDDPDGFVRYKVITAIERIWRHRPHLALPHAVFENAVMQEAARYCRHLTARHDLRQHPRAETSLLWRAVDDKLTRTLDRLYRLLGLLQGEDLQTVRAAIEHGDPRRRAAALEYLDNVLRSAVRKRVLPLIDESPIADKVRHAHQVLGTRPRAFDDTLAWLVHDDDAAVASAAVQFVAEHALWGLAGDLESAAAPACRERRWVAEAATWALARRAQTGSVAPDVGSLPVVEMAARLRRIEMFSGVWADELFRIAEAGRETRHPAGRNLLAGASRADVHLLLEGAVYLESGTGPCEIAAPAVIGAEEALRGTAPAEVVAARTPVVALRIAAADFMTMVSDNTRLALGLFDVTSRRPLASRTAKV